jgi:hypothetical protein
MEEEKKEEHTTLISVMPILNNEKPSSKSDDQTSFEDPKMNNEEVIHEANIYGDGWRIHHNKNQFQWHYSHLPCIQS